MIGGVPWTWTIRAAPRAADPRYEQTEGKG